MGDRYFTRIKDPTRLLPGDILVLPAGGKARAGSPGTWARRGLSVGETRRSDNRTELVKNWLCGDPASPRVFFVASVLQYPVTAAAGLTRLLGLSAAALGDADTTPRTRSAVLVPFGTPEWASGRWTRNNWMGVWDTIRGNTVSWRLAEDPGKDGCVNPGDGDADGLMDRLLTYTESPSLARSVPMARVAVTTAVDFALSNLFDYDRSFVDNNFYGPRIVAKTKFLACVTRAHGAYAVRPSKEFNDLVSDLVFAEACEYLHAAFVSRVGFAKEKMASLARAVKADNGRAGIYGKKAAPAKKAAKGLDRIMKELK